LTGKLPAPLTPMVWRLRHDRQRFGMDDRLVFDQARGRCPERLLNSGQPGGIEFMRVFAEKAYGIPPEQVIGNSGG
jgi:hypothetical protein